MVASGSVAIVDDEAGVVRTYELLFKRRNIPLSFTALDGPDAIEKFKNANPRPGVLIIDYRLPSMSGLDLMKELLTIEPGTKVIFVSGDDNIQKESLDAGAAVFLKKPANIKSITDTVTSLMNY
jgi:two-component system, chemotaxis family, chemotaxis protein CheY